MFFAIQDLSLEYPVDDDDTMESQESKKAGVRFRQPRGRSTNQRSPVLNDGDAPEGFSKHGF